VDPVKRLLLIAFTSLVVPATLAHAHSTAPKTVHAKVSLEQARAAAEAKVPKGTLTSHELEHDRDHLRYSFWFAEPGKSGVKEVSVDAETGKVVRVKHESIEGEQKEKAKELKAHR
jgi:uncharacterized membrane protein YkoI